MPWLILTLVFVVVLLLVGVYAVVRLKRHEIDPIDQTGDDRP
jgi:cation transporter-like permease